MERPAALVGDFSPPTDADVQAVREALAGGRPVAALVTNAHLARSPRFPFTWRERGDMLLGALAPDERARVRIVPLRQFWDEARNAAERRAVLQDEEAQAVRVLDPRPGLLDAWWASGDAEDPASRCPATVIDAMRAWQSTPHFERVRADWRQIAHEKQQWSVAPYPVVLVTVDAVVRVADHVLLIRRGRSPGRGLRALPGGFLEPEDTVYASAVRELREETGLLLDDADVRAALRGVHVFDHPDRSQRGRVVTHAHYFDLGDRPPPPVAGGDDAAAAEWVPLPALPDLEDELLDDHFHILDHFLGLLPASSGRAGGNAPTSGDDLSRSATERGSAFIAR